MNDRNILYIIYRTFVGAGGRGGGEFYCNRILCDYLQNPEPL